MQTKFYEPRVYSYKKEGREFIAKYDIVEAESIRGLKEKVVEFINDGFVVEGGMTTFTISKWNKITRSSREAFVYAQTVVCYVVKRDEMKKTYKTHIKD